jgi:hypothetical protein
MRKDEVRLRPNALLSGGEYGKSTVIPQCVVRCRPLPSPKLEISRIVVSGRAIAAYCDDRSIVQLDPCPFGAGIDNAAVFKCCHSSILIFLLR